MSLCNTCEQRCVSGRIFGEVTMCDFYVKSKIVSDLEARAYVNGYKAGMKARSNIETCPVCGTKFAKDAVTSEIE